MNLRKRGENGAEKKWRRQRKEVEASKERSLKKGMFHDMLSKNIFESGELLEEPVVSKMETTAAEPMLFDETGVIQRTPENCWLLLIKMQGENGW